MAAISLEELLGLRTDLVEVRDELADHLLEAGRAGVGAAPGQALRDDDLGLLARRRRCGVHIAPCEGVPTVLDCVCISTHRCLLALCPLFESARKPEGMS